MQRSGFHKVHDRGRSGAALRQLLRARVLRRVRPRADVGRSAGLLRLVALHTSLTYTLHCVYTG